MGQRRKGDQPAIEDGWGDLAEPASGSRRLAPDLPSDKNPGRRTVPFETPSAATRSSRPGDGRPGSVRPTPYDLPASRRRQSDRVRRDSFAATHEDRRRFLAMPFDERLRQGAKNVIANGLGLGEGDELVVITEQEGDDVSALDKHGCETIAASLISEAADLGARVSAFRLDAAFCEDTQLVARLLENVRKARGSLLVSSVNLPASFRRAVIDAGGDRRHGHMVGVTPEMMRQSVRANLPAIEALGRRLLSRLGDSCRLEVRGAPGTELVVQCGGGLRWHNQSGVLHGPGWTNFPSGELFTTPLSVEGTLVPDGGVWLPDGSSIGRTGKLRLHFAAGRLAHADGAEAPRLLDALGGVKNARRVGQVAFGTNASVLTSIGALLQDLKMPGLHLSLGHTCGPLTGADFDCTQEIPLLLRRPDVLLNGKPVLVRGRFARDLGQGPSFS